MSFDELGPETYVSQAQSDSPKDSDDGIFISESQSEDEHISYLATPCESKSVS